MTSGDQEEADMRPPEIRPSGVERTFGAPQVDQVGPEHGHGDGRAAFLAVPRHVAGLVRTDAAGGIAMTLRPDLNVIAHNLANASTTGFRAELQQRYLPGPRVMSCHYRGEAVARELGYGRGGVREVPPAERAAQRRGRDPLPARLPRVQGLPRQPTPRGRATPRRAGSTFPVLPAGAPPARPACRLQCPSRPGSHWSGWRPAAGAARRSGC